MVKKANYNFCLNDSCIVYQAIKLLKKKNFKNPQKWFPRTIKAVSYTHLDVYKRQTLIARFRRNYTRLR